MVSNTFCCSAVKLSHIFSMYNSISLASDKSPVNFTCLINNRIILGNPPEFLIIVLQMCSSIHIFSFVAIS